jgi:hypothetical protein
LTYGGAHSCSIRYGAKASAQLLRWRNASHWSNFEPVIRRMLSRAKLEARAAAAGHDPGHDLGTEELAGGTERCERARTELAMR